MADVTIETAGFPEVQKVLQNAAKRSLDLTPVNRKFGAYMRDGSIPENFRRGGRPVTWKPVRSRWGGSPVQPLLDTGNLLRSVGFYTEGNDLVLGAGNRGRLRYAKLHQFGGVVKPHKKYLAIPCVPPLTPNQARTTWPRDLMGKGTWIMRGPEGFGVYRKSRKWIASALPQARGKKLYATAKYKSGTKSVEMIFRLVKNAKIPARPFLLFQAADAKRYVNMALAFILKGEEMTA